MNYYKRSLPDKTFLHSLLEISLKNNFSHKNKIFVTKNTFLAAQNPLISIEKLLFHIKVLFAAIKRFLTKSHFALMEKNSSTRATSIPKHSSSLKVAFPNFTKFFKEATAQSVVYVTGLRDALLLQPSVTLPLFRREPATRQQLLGGRLYGLLASP